MTMQMDTWMNRIKKVQRLWEAPVKTLLDALPRRLGSQFTMKLPRSREKLKALESLDAHTNIVLKKQEMTMRFSRLTSDRKSVV